MSEALTGTLSALKDHLTQMPWWMWLLTYAVTTWWMAIPIVRKRVKEGVVLDGGEAGHIIQFIFAPVAAPFYVMNYVLVASVKQGNPRKKANTPDYTERREEALKEDHRRQVANAYGKGQADEKRYSSDKLASQARMIQERDDRIVVLEQNVADLVKRKDSPTRDHNFNTNGEEQSVYQQLDDEKDRCERLKKRALFAEAQWERNLM